MIYELLKATAGIAVLLTAWLGVQRLFAARAGRADEDALAGRVGCHGCACETPCEHGRAARHTPSSTN